MSASIGAAGDRQVVLKGILSGIESRNEDLLLPRLVNATPADAAEGKIKIIAGGHMEDGGDEDAFDNAPGENIEEGPDIIFDKVGYECGYKRLHKLVPKEEARADVELPMSIVQIYSRVLMGTLLRNRDLKLVKLLENTAWANTETLGAGDKWSNDDSDPVDKLLEKVDASVMVPNVVVFGAKSWREFQTHPKVLSALNVTRDRALADEGDFRRILGDKLGIGGVVVYRLRVSNGKPLESITTAKTIRRFEDKVWMGHISRLPGVPMRDSRGRHHIVTDATALSYLVEDALEYEEAEAFNPKGRQMTVGMSYDLVKVSADLGCRLDGVVA